MCSLIRRSWLGQLGSSLLPDGESQLAEIALGLQGCVLREVKHARRSHRRGVTHAKSICHVLVVPCPTGRDHGQANRGSHDPGEGADAVVVAPLPRRWPGRVPTTERPGAISRELEPPATRPSRPAS